MLANPGSQGPAARTALLCELVTRLAGDLHAGCLRRLGAYLPDYQGLEEDLAREYLALVDPGDQPHEPAHRLGRYELVQEIARGGQGTVWLARDPELRRPVAVKLLTGDAGPGSARWQRLRREAEAIARLDHPGICRLHAAELDHDPPFVVLQLVPGQSLAVKLDEMRPRDRRSLQALLAFGEAAARALHAAHEAGILHRDVKPSNLMVTPQGDPVLIDFGLAKHAHERLVLTVPGQAVGTLHYMAPEQLDHRLGVEDHRADVFALGATLYQCVTGKVPFAAPMPSEVLRRAELGPRWKEVALPRVVPPELVAVLDQALRYRAHERYPTALALAEDLRRVAERRPVLAQRATVLRRTTRWAQRHPWLAAWLVALWLAALTALGLAVASERALARSLVRQGTLHALLDQDDPFAQRRDATANLLDQELLAGVPAATALDVARLRLTAGDAAGALRCLQGRPADALALTARLMAGEVETARAMLEAKSLDQRRQWLATTASIARQLVAAARWAPFDTLSRSIHRVLPPAGPLHTERAAFVRLDAVRQLRRGRSLAATLHLLFDTKLVKPEGIEATLDHLAMLLDWRGIHYEVSVVFPWSWLLQKWLRHRPNVPPRVKLRAQSLYASAIDRIDLDAAWRQLQAILPEQEALVGPDHGDTLETRLGLVRCAYFRSDPAQLQLALDAAARARRSLPADSALRAAILLAAGEALCGGQRGEDAEPYFAEAATIRMRALGLADARAAVATLRHAEARYWANQREPSEALIQALLGAMRQDLDLPREQRIELLLAILSFGGSVTRDLVAAEATGLELLRLLPAGDTSSTARQARDKLASAWLDAHRGQPAQALAVELARVAARWQERADPAHRDQDFAARILLAGARSQATPEHQDRAMALLAAAVANCQHYRQDRGWREQLLAWPRDALTLALLELAGQLCHQRDELEWAERFLRRGLSPWPLGDRDFDSRLRLGQILTKQGKLAEAELHLRRCCRDPRGSDWLGSVVGLVAPISLNDAGRQAWQSLRALSVLSEQPEAARDCERALAR